MHVLVASSRLARGELHLEEPGSIQWTYARSAAECEALLHGRNWEAVVLDEQFAPGETATLVRAVGRTPLLLLVDPGRGATWAPLLRAGIDELVVVDDRPALLAALRRLHQRAPLSLMLVPYLHGDSDHSLRLSTGLLPPDECCMSLSFAEDGSAVATSASDSFAAVFGCTLEAYLARGGLRAMVDPETARRLDESERRLLARELTRAEHVVLAHLPGGVARWLRLACHVEYAPDTGRPTRLLVAVRDVTAQQRTADALRLVEDRQRSLVENVPVGIVMHDARGRIFDCNELALELLGLTRDQILGRSSFDPEWRVVHEDGSDFPGATHPATRALVTRVPVRNVVMGVHRPRTRDRVWLHVNALPVLDERGEVDHVVASFADITRALRDEAALRESQERFRATIEGSPDAVFWLRSCRDDAREITDFEFVEMNSRAERQLSMPKSQLLGRRICEVFPINRTGGFFAQYKRVIETRTVLEQDYHVPPPNPAPGWFHHTVVPVHDGVAIFNRDISERRLAAQRIAESEQRFRTAFESSGSGMLLVTPDLRITQVNAAFCQFIGFTAEELCARTVADITLPDERERTTRGVEQLLSGELAVLHLEKQYCHRDGRTVWGSTSAAVVRDAEGAPIHFVAQVQDITERKQAEAEKRRLEAQLLQAQKMEALGRLAGGVAHDFNNVLAAILGYAEHLRNFVQAEPQAVEATQEIVDAAARGAALVRQILAFSRRSERRLTPIRLDTVVSQSLRLLRAALPAAIELHSEMSVPGPMVMADATQIQQVLTNLSTNAWHAMESGGVLSIKLDLVQLDAEAAKAVAGLRAGPYARLRVSDTGAGMDEQTVRHIFEPFFTTKPTGKGTGLGLSVVHGIVHDHGGTITVRSATGAGTTFEIYLPTTTRQPAAPAASAALPPRGDGERILVVDDEPALARVLTRLLTNLGYTVDSTSDPEVGLSQFKQDPARFDLAIIDYNMPTLSGRDLARQLVALRPGFPILMTSGYSAPLDPSELPALGIRAVIPKPVAQADLAESVRRALRG